METARFADWIASLEARHLADLTFREAARALRALSSTYVERRHKLAEGGALATAGKRAAFALFYAPLHFLLVDHIVRQLPGATTGMTTLTDLGCGTGSSGAAWAAACERPPRIVGIDRNAWALGEAVHTYRAFGLAGKTQKGEVRLKADAPYEKVRLTAFAKASAPEKADAPSEGQALLAAFTINELSDAAREALLPALLDRAARGARVLLVEPIAGGAARWWGAWGREFERAGGRGDEWRFRAELPAIVRKLDRAAGLDHRELTARSLWVGGRETKRSS